MPDTAMLPAGIASAHGNQFADQVIDHPFDPRGFFNKHPECVALLWLGNAAPYVRDAIAHDDVDIDTDRPVLLGNIGENLTANGGVTPRRFGSRTIYARQRPHQVGAAHDADDFFS